MGSCERVAGVLGDFGDYELLEEITTRTTDLDPYALPKRSRTIIFKYPAPSPPAAAIGNTYRDSHFDKTTIFNRTSSL